MKKSLKEAAKFTFAFFVIVFMCLQILFGQVSTRVRSHVITQQEARTMTNTFVFSKGRPYSETIPKTAIEVVYTSQPGAAICFYPYLNDAGNLAVQVREQLNYDWQHSTPNQIEDPQGKLATFMTLFSRKYQASAFNESELMAQLFTTNIQFINVSLGMDNRDRVHLILDNGITFLEKEFPPVQ